MQIITISIEDLKCENSALRQKSMPYLISGRENLIEIVNRMREELYGKDYGTGLSAIQIGLPVRIFIINLDRSANAEIIAINPEIISTSGRLIRRREGCLSLPNYFGTVARRNNIKFRAQDISGKERVFVRNGYEAAVIQHEFDHLDGVLYWDKMENGKSPQPIKVI